MNRRQLHLLVLRDGHTCHPARVENSRGPRTITHHPTHDLQGAYFRDAHAVGLVVERGRVVIHVSNLDIHLPRDHLGRKVQGSTLSLPSGLIPPTQPRDLRSPGAASSSRAAGPQGTLTPWWSLTENSTVNSDLV